MNFLYSINSSMDLRLKAFIQWFSNLVIHQISWKASETVFMVRFYPSSIISEFWHGCREYISVCMYVSMYLYVCVCMYVFIFSVKLISWFYCVYKQYHLWTLTYIIKYLLNSYVTAICWNPFRCPGPVIRAVIYLWSRAFPILQVRNQCLERLHQLYCVTQLAVKVTRMEFFPLHLEEIFHLALKNLENLKIYVLQSFPAHPPQKANYIEPTDSHRMKQNNLFIWQRKFCH